MRKFLTIALAVVAVFTACKKADFDNTVTGEAVGALTLLSPGADSIVLNPATPDAPITFKWTPAAPGVEATVKYRVIAKRRTAPSFDAEHRVFELPSDNNGLATQLTITYKQLDDVLKASLIGAAAQRAELAWTVEAYNEKNGSTLANSSNLLILKRSTNGSTPFSILGPATSTAPITINPNSTSDYLKFNWTRSVPAPVSPAVRYVVNVYKDDEAGTPLFKIESDNGGADSLVTISHKALSDSLIKYGYTEMATAAGLKWNVTATSGSWVINSDYTNQLYILREVKMFIVGSATPIDWDIAKALRMIEDRRNPGTFYMYVYLNTGDLKFVNAQQWPPAPGVMDYGQKKSAPAGELTEQDEDNIVISTAGVYRVTVDTRNMKYYLQSATSNGIGGMGMIGGFQGWSQPAEKMDYVSVNRFNYLTDMTSGDGFKFHDGNDWDNSSPDKNRWFGLSGTTFGEDPGNYNDIKYTGPTGLARVIWDATDPTNMRYTVIPGKLYAIGGDANLGSWNNAAGNTSMPEFTYLDNGKWQATITVSGPSEFKLVVQQGNWDIMWGKGATDGTMQNRYYDADPAPFQFSAAGTYTVVVDEYAGTISW